LLSLNCSIQLRKQIESDFKMSATFFGERDLLPSVDQYWSDEDDELEVPTPETRLKVAIDDEFKDWQPNRVFVSFVHAEQLHKSLPSTTAGLKAIGSINGEPLEGRIFACESNDKEGRQSVWLQLDDLHLLRRRAQVERVLTVLGEQLHQQFPSARVCLLGMQATFDEPLQCFTSDDQLTDVLRPFQLQPPLVLCRNAEAALFSWRVKKELPVEYFRLPRLADQLPSHIVNDDTFLPRALRQNLWPEGGRQYLRAANNLYA
jgi:hypothetical protein